jgi:HSP20 family protein
MAQNERQGMEAAATGTSGTQPGSTTSSEQRRGSTGSGTGGTVSGRESPEAGGRLSRREGQPFGALLGASPFALFRLLSDDMERLFFGRETHGQGQLGPIGGGRFMPQVDIEEHDDKLVVRADLPGVEPDDFRVDIDDDALVIQGERRDTHEDTRRGVHRFERSYGSFRRVVPLPAGANVENADARFENGVLEIEIPVQQSKSRRLDIHAGASKDTPSGSETSEKTRH